MPTSSPARPRPIENPGRSQMMVIVAGAVAIALFAFAGFRALRLGSSRRQELQKAESTLQTLAEQRRRFRPAAAAESLSWRRTWQQLQELGVGSGERLSLTQRVSRIAEDAGLRGVRVLIDLPDTTGQQLRLSTDWAQSKLAPYSLRVECRGDLESVVTFLGRLPQSVAPTKLSLVRQDGRGPHRISLAVYELTFTDGVPPGWSSLERGRAGTGSGGRTGR